MFKNFCKQLGIKNHYFSPAHPQTNGKVEVTNRSLLKLIKTQLKEAKRIWLDKLPSTLWVYRTTARTPTREIPFRLAFGCEAVILAEVGIASYRIAHHNEGKNEEGIRLHLDLLDEVRATAEQRMTRYQDLMAKHYNTKVKPRYFSIENLVLRKVTTTTKDLTQGKQGPKWEGPYRIIDCNRKGTYCLEMLDGQMLHHPWNAEHLRKYYQ